MKANEIVWKDVNDYYFNTNIKSGHYKMLMKFGRVFPSTKSQAKFFVKERIEMDPFNNKDVERVELLLNKHGYYGVYKYTRSREWVRLVNYEDFYAALKKEFSI